MMLMYGWMLPLALTAVMSFLPDIPLARWLNKHLVERPARRLSRLRRHHLVYALLLIGMLYTVGELLPILGSVDVAMAMAWNASLYFDAVAVSFVVALAANLKAAMQVLRARSGLGRGTSSRRYRSARQRRIRSPRPSKTPDNDDDRPAEYSDAA
jgi:hypothetical protein